MIQNKQKKILVSIPKGQEERFRTYADIARQLGVKSINAHIWDLIQADELKLFAIIQTLTSDRGE